MGTSGMYLFPAKTPLYHSPFVIRLSSGSRPEGCIPRAEATSKEETEMEDAVVPEDLVTVAWSCITGCRRLLCIPTQN